MPTNLSFVAIGQIVKPHGVFGEFKLLPLTDFVEERFSALSEFYLLKDDRSNISDASPQGDASRIFEGSAMADGDVRKCTVKSVKMSPKYVIVGSPEIKLDDVERLRGSFIYIRKEDAMKLSENQFYPYQLVGMTVVDVATGEAVGEVTEAMNGIGNDAIEICFNGAKNAVLVPFVKEFVKKIDFDQHRIYINVMEGLI
ncbi:MAG TPA: ribosome maturation factor RimM [Candidatus Wallbacteria bacterium]|nr:ribosome maturation factor RimM [Candidatus Wallbacteria bacterium]